MSARTRAFFKIILIIHIDFGLAWPAAFRLWSNSQVQPETSNLLRLDNKFNNGEARGESRNINKLINSLKKNQ